MELKEYKKKFLALQNELRKELGTNGDITITITSHLEERCPDYFTDYAKVEFKIEC